MNQLTTFLTIIDQSDFKYLRNSLLQFYCVEVLSKALVKLIFFEQFAKVLNKLPLTQKSAKLSERGLILAQAH